MILSGWIIIIIGIVFIVGPEFIYQKVGFNTGLFGLIAVLCGAGLLKLARKIRERAMFRKDQE